MDRDGSGEMSTAELRAVLELLGVDDAAAAELIVRQIDGE